MEIKFNSEDELKHCIYHTLIPLFEHYLKLDPCQAIKLAGEEANKFTNIILQIKDNNI